MPCLDAIPKVEGAFDVTYQTANIYMIVAVQVQYLFWRAGLSLYPDTALFIINSFPKYDSYAVLTDNLPILDRDSSL